MTGQNVGAFVGDAVGSHRLLMAHRLRPVHLAGQMLSDQQVDPTLYVSGAGPAGLSAAITAARAGRPVVVYERATTVGGRFHDDFQGLENWTTENDVLEELASFGIEVNFDCTPLRETVIFDPSGRAHVYRAALPLYYMIRRGPGAGTLDSGLRAQAEHAGVNIRFGEPCRHLPHGGIVAEGPHGPDAVAVGYVFDTNMRRKAALCVMEGCDCTWCRCQHRVESADATGARVADVA